MDYDGVIFDMDGVILDSGLNDFEWMDKIRRKKASELGYDLTGEEAMKLVHSSDFEQVQEMIEKKNMTVEEVVEVEHRVQNAKISLIEHGAIRLFPETEKILNGIERPVGLATNSPSKTARFALNFFGIRDCFDAVEALKIDSFERYIEFRKPHPYMLESVMEELGLENPVMVGDTGDDVNAARNAGIDSVLVQSYSDRKDLEPTHRIRELHELRSVIR